MTDDVLPAHPASPLLRVQGSSRLAFGATTAALVTLASGGTAVLVNYGTQSVGSVTSLPAGASLPAAAPSVDDVVVDGVLGGVDAAQSVSQPDPTVQALRGALAQRRDPGHRTLTVPLVDLGPGPAADNPLPHTPAVPSHTPAVPVLRPPTIRPPVTPPVIAPPPVQPPVIITPPVHKPRVPDVVPPKVPPTVPPTSVPKPSDDSSHWGDESPSHGREHGRPRDQHDGRDEDARGQRHDGRHDGDRSERTRGKHEKGRHAD